MNVCSLKWSSCQAGRNASYFTQLQRDTGPSRLSWCLYFLADCLRSSFIFNRNHIGCVYNIPSTIMMNRFNNRDRVLRWLIGSQDHAIDQGNHVSGIQSKWKWLKEPRRPQVKCLFFFTVDASHSCSPFLEVIDAIISMHIASAFAGCYYPCPD